MAHPDFDEHLRRQLRTLQRVVGAPTDAALARRSGVAAATFSEAMSGKRRLRDEFVAKVISGCVATARASGHAVLDEQHVLHALRLPGHTAADSGILERDEVLNSCSAVLDGVRARSGATIVVEGPAGIGKSELLARVCAESAVRGITPLVVRGNQHDQTLAFGGVRTLLGRWVAGRAARDQQRLFAGAASLAKVPLGMPHTRRGSMIGFIEALYWLVVNATRGEEVLLFAVDDAHWLDEESLDWLEFLADRLAGLPVVLLLAHRPDEALRMPALTRIALRAAQVIRPAPLSLDAVRTIVGRSLAGRGGGPDGAFCSAFLEHSGGNPFYLRWMLTLARDRGLTPTASAAARVRGLTPRQVVLYLNQRLDRLGPDARLLARTVAVLGPGSPLTRAIHLAGLAPEDGKQEYDRLCEAEILAEGSTVDFRHPITRRAVYDAIDPSQRSDLHLAAARLLHNEDTDTASDTATDNSAVAAHLLRVRADGDPWVVDRLCAAAADAMASGLSSTAARYLSRAVAEPPPPGERCRVRLRHGQALALGELAAALPELLAAYRMAPDDSQRTEAAIALAKTYSYANRLGDAVRHLDRAIEHVPEGVLSGRLQAEQLLWATWWADDPRRAERMRLLDRLAPPLGGEDHVQRLLIALHAWSLVLRGRPRDEAAAAIGPVTRHGVTFADLEHGMEVATVTAFVHMFSNDLTAAGRMFDQAVREFHRDGWRGTHLAFARAHQGNVALYEGRLADAVVDAEIALRLADRTGSGTPAELFATGTLIEALLARGEVARAAAVRAARDYGDAQPDAVVLPIPWAVRGALELATGETRRAVATLRRAGQWLEPAHLRNPAVCPWQFHLAMGLRHSAPDEAREILDVARERAERFGNPLTRARALRTLAVLEPRTATESLAEGARLLADGPNRLERAHTLAELGEALARGGHDATEPLSQAMALADECDAPALRTALAQRLRVRPERRRINRLDPDRQRVTRLAADGLSDADIAYELVLDLDTVVTLRRESQDILGAESRAELRHALTDGTSGQE